MLKGNPVSEGLKKANPVNWLALLSEARQNHMGELIGLPTVVKRTCSRMDVDKLKRRFV
jgi:hypothetical protein